MSEFSLSQVGLWWGGVVVTLKGLYLRALLRGEETSADNKCLKS